MLAPRLEFEQLGAHIGHRQVVVRVVGVLPDEPGVRGVGDDDTTEIEADPLGRFLDADPPMN